MINTHALTRDMLNLQNYNNCLFWHAYNIRGNNIILVNIGKKVK